MNGRKGASLTAAYAAAFFAVVIWGTTFAAEKVAVEQASAIFVVALRFALSLPFIALIAACRGELRLPTRRQAWVLALMGFIGLYLIFILQTAAMKTASSVISNWQMAAAPAMVAVMAWIFLKEKLSGGKIAGIVTAFVGVGIVLGLGTTGAVGFSSYSMGDFYVTASTVIWAVFMILTRLIFKDGGYTPIFTFFWESFFSVLFCVPTLLFLHTDVTVAADFTARTWTAMLVLVICCSCLAYTWWYYATSRLPVAQVMLFQFFQPVVGALTGYCLLGERFTVWLLVGGVTILFGVWIVNRQ